jgi:PHP family Zn ribbon phosphoesterase
MAEVVDPRIAEAILRTRDGRVKVVPGYDGVYGQMTTLPQEEKEVDMKEREVNRGETRERSGETPRQKSLADYV